MYVYIYISSEGPYIDGASFWQRLMNSTDDAGNDDNDAGVKRNVIVVVATPTLPK